MQGIGYIIIGGEKIKVLWRYHKTYVALKLRKTGSDGMYFADESSYLKHSASLVKKLKNGQVIRL